MARLTYSELVKQTKILATNGTRADVQAILGPIGYDADELAAGLALAAAVETGQADTLAAKAAQTKATRAEQTARKAAKKEAVTFAETARIVFADDPPTLLALGLQTQYQTETDAETGETKQVAARLSETTADVVARWLTYFNAADGLDAPSKAILTAAGWPASRITTARGFVNAYATADTAQQAAIQGYQARSDQHKAEVETLRGWHSRAHNLCRVAIKSADPTNAQQYLELLGLV